MRRHNFGDIFMILPEEPLKGSSGAYNRGREAVCISDGEETTYSSLIMAAPLYGKIYIKDYNNLTVCIRTGSGKRYIKLLSASPIPKYRIGKKTGEISEEEKKILKDALRLLFDI